MKQPMLFMMLLFLKKIQCFKFLSPSFQLMKPYLPLQPSFPITKESLEIYWQSCRQTINLFSSQRHATSQNSLIKDVKNTLDALFPSQEKYVKDIDASDSMAVASSLERLELGRQAQGFSEGEVMPDWMLGELTYGEFDYDFFIELINNARSQLPKEKQQACNFFEIGSGCGRLTFAAAMIWEWNKCTGVEIVESLHALAIQAREILLKPDNMGPFKSEVELLCSDVHTSGCGLQQADIIFSYCSTFPSYGNELTEMSATIGTTAKPGSIIITTDKVLSPDGPWQFELLNVCTGTNKETAGSSTAYIWKVLHSNPLPL